MGMLRLLEGDGDLRACTALLTYAEAILELHNGALPDIAVYVLLDVFAKLEEVLDDSCEFALVVYVMFNSAAFSGVLFLALVQRDCKLSTAVARAYISYLECAGYDYRL